MLSKLPRLVMLLLKDWEAYIFLHLCFPIDDLIASLGEPGNCYGQVRLNNLPVCYDNWDDSHSKIVCQEQRCSNIISFEKIDKGSQGDAHFVSCIGSESKLGQCKTRRGKCGSGLVSVSCAGKSSILTLKTCRWQAITNRVVNAVVMFP